MDNLMSLCPTCEMMNVNHSECVSCGEQFSKNSQVRKVSSQVLKETFLPKFIKLDEENAQQETIESSAVPSDVTSASQSVGHSKTKAPIPESELLAQNNSKDITIEKRIRIFCYESQPEYLDWIKESCFNVVTTSKHKIEMDSSPIKDDTVIEESLANSELKIIHFLRVNRRTFSNIPFIDSTYFTGIERVVFNCPFSATNLKTCLQMFRGVPAIKFTAGFFIPHDGELNNPAADLSIPESMQFEFEYFTAKFGLDRFNNLKEPEQREVISKSLFLLQVAADCLPHLKFCNISLPHTSSVEQVVDTLIVRLPFKGRKTVDYEKNEICYKAGSKQDIYAVTILEETPERLEVLPAAIKSKAQNIEKRSLPTDEDLSSSKRMKESASRNAASSSTSTVDKSRKSTAIRSSIIHKKSKSSHKRSLSP